MDHTLYDAVKNRRSFYAIGKETILPDEEILDIVHHAVSYAPTAFNSQGNRVLVLLGDAHDRLWNITNDILKKIVPPESFASTEQKIKSFQNGYGTVLYFEDTDAVKGLQDKFPTYAQNFPDWSRQASGMLQYSIWMMLENAGYGVSLQHYNPLIDEQVKADWQVPEQWRLIAEMPFGKPLAQPDEKSFLPIDERVKMFK